MASENVKKLIECEKKAKEMVTQARNERSDLLSLSQVDADIAIEKIREEHDEILEKEQLKEERDVDELIKLLKGEKDSDLRNFGCDISGCEGIIDEIVNMVSGTGLD